MTSTVDSTATVQAVPLERSTSKDLQRIANRLETNRNERDALILKAYGEGASLREIGNLLGVNHVTVKNILERIEADNMTVMSVEEHRRRTGIGDDDTRF